MIGILPPLYMLRVDFGSLADHEEKLRSQVQHLKSELVATTAAHEEEETQLMKACP